MNKTRYMLFLGWVTLIIGLYIFTLIMGVAIGELVSVVIAEIR